MNLSQNLMVELVNICNNVLRSSGFNESFFSSNVFGDCPWVCKWVRKWKKVRNLKQNSKIYRMALTFVEVIEEVRELWFVRIWSSKSCSDENDWMHWLHCAITVLNSLGCRRLMRVVGLMIWLSASSVCWLKSMCPLLLPIGLKFVIGIIVFDGFGKFPPDSITPYACCPCPLSSKWFFWMLTFGLPSNELNNFGSRIADSSVGSASALNDFFTP